MKIADEHRPDQNEPRQDHQDFFEAMPGTMDRSHLGRAAEDTEDNERSSRMERRSILPWILIPLAALLGLALFSALANNATETDQTAPGLQQTQDLD